MAVVICSPCREAGHLNADACRVYDEESADYLRLRALEKHGECPGRCDCQHRVGEWRNNRNDAR